LTGRNDDPRVDENVKRAAVRLARYADSGRSKRLNRSEPAAAPRAPPHSPTELAALSGEPGRIRLGLCGYIQTLEVPFHWRPAPSHALLDV